MIKETILDIRTYGRIQGLQGGDRPQRIGHLQSVELDTAATVPESVP